MKKNIVKIMVRFNALVKLKTDLKFKLKTFQNLIKVIIFDTAFDGNLV